MERDFTEAPFFGFFFCFFHLFFAFVLNSPKKVLANILLEGLGEE